MPKGVYTRSEEQKEKLRGQLKGVRPPIESLAAHYASIRGDGNPAKRADVRAKISLNRRGIPVSDETKRKIGATRTARYKKNPRSRGSTAMDVIWRKFIFERDDYTCQICKIRGGKLHADHIKPYVAFPELRYDTNNGRCLCAACHRKTDTYGFRARKFIPL